MNSANDQAARLEAAIEAQERLRPTLGGAVVDVTISALRRELAAARGQVHLASLRSHLPGELAAKAEAAGWAAGDRRQATVLFADLAGFTAVSERADPEVIRGFQHDLFRELARIIYQYEGFVEKFVGDAVLAVFGAPITHEDDPERALRAALTMRERMATLNQRWSEKLGKPVTLHVGINTGPVVAGKLGVELEGGGTYAVTGDTVNTAARLEEAARPGQILVSLTTYRLAQEAFTFQALEPIQVRNRSEPLAVFELDRARPLPGKRRGLQELGEAFVGRTDELEQFQAVLDELADSGRVVLITGEAGIGKSRLAAEWRKRTQDGARWLEGRCFARTMSLSYGPFLDMLRRYAGIADDDSDRQARRRLDVAAGRLFPGDAEASAILASLLGMRPRRDESVLLARLSDPRALRERIFGLVEQLVTRLVVDGPLVLFLEDMQWADSSTLELVEHLLELTNSVRLVVAIAGREDPDSPMARLKATIGSQYERRATHLRLDRLSDETAAAMVRDLLSVRDLPPNLDRLIRERGDGNPFFIEEIIRTLIELGALRRDGETWATTQVMQTVRVPETLQGLIMARIDRLPDETREVVQYAAVIGRTFLYRVLLAIAQPTPSLDADLTHLERSELIRERTRVPEVEYTFKHALTQEVAYQSLLSSRLREFHRRVGEAMERIFADRLGEFYAILAEHFRKAEVWDKAADYEIKAGDHASQLFAAEARAHYERGLAALAPLRATAELQRRTIDATIALTREICFGASAATTSELAHHLDLLKEAERVAGRLVAGRKRAATSDRLRQARVYAWLAYVFSVHAEYGPSQHYVDKVRALTTEIEDPDLAVRIGQVLVGQGRFGPAASFLAPVVGPLEEQGRWLDWVHANGGLALAEAAQGHYWTARQRAERGVMRSVNLQGANLIDSANLYLVMVYLLGGEYALARKWVDQPTGKVVNPRAEYIRAILKHWVVEAKPNDADYAEVLSEHDNPGATHDKPEYKHLAMRHWHDAFLSGTLHKANSDGALEKARTALAEAENEHNLFGEGFARRYLALIQAKQSPQDPEIDTQMSMSRDRFTDGGCHLEAARTLVAWGQLGLERGDPDAPGRLREALRIFEEAELPWEVEFVRSYL